MPTASDPLARAYHHSVAWRWLATVVPMPALVPLMMLRGLDLAEIGMVMATFALVTAVLELPTGGLADTTGRVRTTLVADALAIVARIGLLVAGSVGPFVLAAALAGAARALGSGALEAWYVDARLRRDGERDLRRPLARAGVVEALALGAGTLGGGALPLLAPALGVGPAGGVAALQLAFGASILLGAASLIVTARLRESAAGPLRARADARPDRVARRAWAVLGRERSLLTLLALGAAGGALVMSIEAFFPAELGSRIGSGTLTLVLGATLAGAFAATAVGQAIGGRSARGRSARLRTAVAGHLVVAGGIAAIAAPAAPGAIGPIVAVLGLWCAYFGLGLAAPAVAAAFHALVPARDRAALVAARSLSVYAGGVAATIAFGAAAAAYDLRAVWPIAAAVAVVAAGLAAAWRAAPARATVGAATIDQATTASPTSQGPR